MKARTKGWGEEERGEWKGREAIHTFLFSPHNRRLRFLGAGEFGAGLLSPTFPSALTLLFNSAYIL